MAEPTNRREAGRLLPAPRRIYCNRTLNMRSIQAVGYDMDYTLIHYRVEAWERRAYEHLKRYFLAEGWPVADFQFDPALVCRGLIVDTEGGNLLKANRFGFVRRSMHGCRLLDFEEQRRQYARVIIDLADRRWAFLNTLFSLSEGCMYAQLVDLLDAGRSPMALDYAELYSRVRQVIDQAHMEGKLKAEILADPDRFVLLDDESPLALLDQRHAGKKLMLITNSEWSYTVPMMSYAFDRFLPAGMGWRDLFDVVIVAARKPLFFTAEAPFFEVMSDDGLLRPAPMGGLRPGTMYYGGSAREVERHLGLSGDQILYVGDHMFGDVRVTKDVLRWRTALILRELEDEIAAVAAFQDSENELARLMADKEAIETEMSDIRLRLQRARSGYGPDPGTPSAGLNDRYAQLRLIQERLDRDIAPLARAAGQLSNPTWGLLMRAGNDKSKLAYQVERYADIYTSRVSNFGPATPFFYVRSPRGSLPHDPSLLSEQVSMA
jgi:5'-nucleotidase